MCIWWLCYWVAFTVKVDADISFTSSVVSVPLAYVVLLSGCLHPCEMLIGFYVVILLNLPILPQFKSTMVPRPDEVGLDGSFTEVMKEAFCDGPDAWLRSSFADSLKMALLSLGVAEFPVAAKQVLLYLKTSVDTFGTVCGEAATRDPRGLRTLQTVETPTLRTKGNCLPS